MVYDGLKPSPNFEETGQRRDKWLEDAALELQKDNESCFLRSKSKFDLVNEMLVTHLVKF